MYMPVILPSGRTYKICVSISAEVAHAVHSPKGMHVHVHEFHQILGLRKEHGGARLRLKKPEQTKQNRAEKQKKK